MSSGRFTREPGAVRLRALPAEIEIPKLANAALQRASDLGVEYADVRLTLTRDEVVRISGPSVELCSVEDTEEYAVGLRVLVDGAWGVAASSQWTETEVQRLAHEAVAVAKASRGPGKELLRNFTLPVARGRWSTPGRDPFAVSLEEKYSLGMAFVEAPERLDLGTAFATGNCRFHHRRQEKTFASTNGSYTAQTLYLTDHHYRLSVNRNGVRAVYPDDRWQPQSGGWEVASDPALFDGISRVAESGVQMTYDKTGSLNPGRYDVVFDANTIANMAGHTIGIAAELDRVLGYESNAGGTSYLPPPDGQSAYVFGSPQLNVSANRSDPTGLATTGWDDDGVAPSEYSVVESGTLVNYHASQSLLARVSARPATGDDTLRSHGCAGGENAMGEPTIHTPNLVIHPQVNGATLDELVADLNDGIVVLRGVVTTDRQKLNGEVTGGAAYKVERGKRVRRIEGAEVLFRSPEFWKSVRQIGGPHSQFNGGLVDVEKGQPVQRLSFSVAAVPMRAAGMMVTGRTTACSYCF